MRRYLGISLVLVLVVLVSAQAFQQEDSTILTLERIFSSDELTLERFGPAKWLADGSGYTTLEQSGSEGEGMDIVKYYLTSEKREVLVSSKHLIPEGENEPLRIADYSWSQGGKKLLIFTNTRRVWRRHTRGDYWVLDLGNWKLHKLGGEAEEATLMFAKFSPDGGRVAYVVKNNIYVENLDSSGIIQLTKDGSDTIINGTFDWVYEEEFGLRDGFRWSPDGEYIAYWQLDAEGIKNFYLINNTDSLYPRLIPVQYPKAGTINSACRAGVVKTGGGETRWFDIPGDPRNNYIAMMEWAAGSEEVVIQRLNRLQNTNQVMLCNAKTGQVRTVYTDRDDAWLDVVRDLVWLEDGKRFTLVSEKDGWRHVYLISRDGKEVRDLTPGEYDVISVEHIDEDDHRLYFIASPENPTQRYLYNISLDGNGKADRLTPTESPGAHSYRVSPDGSWAFRTYSTFDTPPVTDLVSLPGHEVKRTLAANIDLRSKMEIIKRRPVEFFRVDIGGGVELDGWCMKPYDFDPSKRYPVLFHVYGEPAGLTVLDRWRGFIYLWHLMLTQQGYFVASIENRGTPSPRGRAWRKMVYRRVGILASEDQAAAVQALIRRWDFIDPERIGIWGWSGGGSMTLNMLFRYPKMYHTGISVAPVVNQRYYDTIYQERYMGLPDDNPEGFKNGSPITFAHQLEGNLLLIHGTGDDNVHYQNAEALINALIKANKRFSMMSYPNRSHGINEGENTSRHLFETMTWYLHEYLEAGPRPR